MAQPDLCGGQLEHGEIVRGSLFVARGDPSEVFDAIEEALDPVALLVEHGSRSRPSSGDGSYMECSALRRQLRSVAAASRR